MAASHFSEHIFMNSKVLSKKIILAEDNLADFELTKLAFEELDFPVEIIHIGDGQALLDYLKSSSLSDISFLLLDLNMPKINGTEILKIIYQDEILKRLPVIVLSSSLHENDIRTCYEYGANAYVNKPIDINDFNDLIGSIASYWMGVNLGPVLEAKSIS
ncbi:MAG: response regulator [Saprospiraceae bacterium]